MIWDIASIVFVAVTMNHLGLVGAVEKVIGREIPIVGCPKCLTFWVTAGYGCYDIATYGTIWAVLAVAFAASYAAIWLELAEGYIDTLYLKCYGKIYRTADDTAAADAYDGDTAGSVP